jgi:crossover junction endodeoxyribonuclease RusA
MREWVLELPWATPPVKPNGGHGNVYAHAKKVKAARSIAGLLARNAKIPMMGRCEVLLTWYVPDRVARDVDNLAWTLKPLCDGISSGKKPWDHPVVQDDTPEFMVKHMPVIVYEKGCQKRMTLTVRELPELSLPVDAA